MIERDEENSFLSMARDLDVPVIFGDATLGQTLRSARVDRARAVAVLTRDDMTNIETGIVLTEMLGTEVRPGLNWTDVPLVLRVYDRLLGFAVARLRLGRDGDARLLTVQRDTRRTGSSYITVEKRTRTSSGELPWPVADSVVDVANGQPRQVVEGSARASGHAVAPRRSYGSQQ